MAKCQKCVSLRDRIHQCWKSNEDSVQYQKELTDHIDLQRREREELAFRLEHAENNPHDCMMLLCDSPAMILLPNMPVGNKTKDVLEYGIQFRWTGWVNSTWNSQNLIKIAMEPAWYQHGSNYTCSLLDYILEMELGDKSPKLFIMQSDRGPEYNNKGFFYFLGLLVLTGRVQGGVLYGRLPVGHTFVYTLVPSHHM